MYVKTINVDVPFKGCGKCNRFELEVDGLDGEDFYGEPIRIERYSCKYEPYCQIGFKVGNEKENNEESC